MNAIRQSFGDDVFTSEGKLDYPKMWEVAGTDPTKQAKLNSIMKNKVLW